MFDLIMGCLFVFMIVVGIVRWFRGPGPYAPESPYSAAPAETETPERTDPVPAPEAAEPPAVQRQPAHDPWRAGVPSPAEPPSDIGAGRHGRADPSRVCREAAERSEPFTGSTTGHDCPSDGGAVGEGFPAGGNAPHPLSGGELVARRRHVKALRSSLRGRINHRPQIGIPDPIWELMESQARRIGVKPGTMLRYHLMHLVHTDQYRRILGGE
jgi:hypothetical protein